MSAERSKCRVVEAALEKDGFLAPLALAFGIDFWKEVTEDGFFKMLYKCREKIPAPLDLEGGDAKTGLAANDGPVASDAFDGVLNDAPETSAEGGERGLAVASGVTIITETVTGGEDVLAEVSDGAMDSFVETGEVKHVTGMVEEITAGACAGGEPKREIVGRDSIDLREDAITLEGLRFDLIPGFEWMVEELRAWEWGGIC